MCAGHLDLADLHIQGRRWRFQGIEFAFFLTYPGGQALKITAKVIPLDFHHFHGFNTKINQIKLKSSISTKNSKTIFPPYTSPGERSWGYSCFFQSGKCLSRRITRTWCEPPVWAQPSCLLGEWVLEETAPVLPCEQSCTLNAVLC